MTVVFTETSAGEFQLFYIDRMLAWLHAHGITLKRTDVERDILARPSISITFPAGALPTGILKEAVEVGCHPHNAWWKRRVQRHGFFFTEPRRKRKQGQL